MTLETRLRHIEKRLAKRQKPKATVEYSDPLFFARSTLKFAPDPWQEKVLSWEGNRLLLNCSRQSGKSTTTAILALHQVLFFPHSLVLLLSPTLRQSQELFKKVSDFLSVLPVKPNMTEDNKLSLQLTNGSRIVSLPSKESNVRGFSGAKLIVIDEASRVSDALYYSVRPMLAVSGGKLIAMTTPFGKRGFFHQEWMDGQGWEKVLITADHCPRISKAFLEEERRTLGDWWFKQEYLCEFVDTVDQVFSYENVMAALSTEVEPLFPAVTPTTAVVPPVSVAAWSSLIVR